MFRRPPYDILMIAGPSGVGKGTIIAKLRQDFPNLFGTRISHTSRLPRKNEVDGVHYHFRKREEIEELIKQGLFMESTVVHGELYGTSKESVRKVLEENKICIFDITAAAVETISTYNTAQPEKDRFQTRSMFLRPPDMSDLMKRLKERNTESPEKIKIRLETAIKEMDYLEKHPDLFDAVVIQDHKENPKRYGEILQKLLLAPPS
eukprot:PhF_6_TR24413/c1_g1_i1/m.33778/K00942/E2.7.4.8, gmk; guanylate kinase